jgi:stearoyl-CoA desaturase (delta-9 desaturase)
MPDLNAKPRILWLPTLVLTLTPLATLLLVPVYLVMRGFDGGLFAAFLIVLACNGLSITAGYHRLWAHNTYKAHPALRLFFALFGAGATQNSILVWASGHRRHHRFVDDNERDPYSAGRGFWFSHIGWMLRDYPTGRVDFSNIADLQRDPIVTFQHRHYVALAVSMNLLPALVAGWLCGDIWGGIVWVGFLRLVVNHHVTFFINSLAHIWGRRPYTDTNTARDNFWLALLTWGEGYHNFHHIFQTDYRNGVRWWQFDPTKWLIFCASKLGLASQLNRIDDFKIQRALLDMQFRHAQLKLEKAGNAELWRTHLEQEYQQFLACLQEWNTLRQQWYEQKRQQLAEKTAQLQQRWQQTAIHSRLLELEYALKQQRKRLQLLTLQLN